MVTNKTYEYGIKYRVFKLSGTNYVLFPVSVEGGLSDRTMFSTDEGLIPILNHKMDLYHRYVISNVHDTEDLETEYNYDEDTDLLAKKFFEDNKERILYVDSTDKNNLRVVELDTKKGVSSVVINDAVLEKLAKCSTKEEVSGVLTEIIPEAKPDVEEAKDEVTNIKHDGLSKEITYPGIRDAIKEYILGHDEEIETIAQKLYMNYIARKGDMVSSILVAGPSGTGKTETFEIAARYMGVPFVKYNSSKLVRTGIRGKTIESLLFDLYKDSGKNKERAERGIFLLDEFDKLDNQGSVAADGVKDGLLTFLDGREVFHLDGMEEPFDTCLLTIACLGVFERILEPEKGLGFGQETRKAAILTPEELKRKIIEKGYFTDEEISRIKTLLIYNSLDLDTKREILVSKPTSILADKRKRYKEQFGIDLTATDDFVDAIFERLEQESTGMRNLNNFVGRVIDPAEKAILENPNSTFKRLVLTRKTVDDHRKFELE